MNYFLTLLFTILISASPILNAGFAGISEAINSSSGKPAEIEADSLKYDEKNLVVTAEGKVIIVQGKISLSADKVIYNQKSNTVEAIGNVILRETNGNIFFADKTKLRDDLKQGVIENFRITMIDKSRLFASQAERINENISVMKNVHYSPCKNCVKSKKIEPLWQVRAKKATINEDEQKIKYNHAFFEIKGVPVLYTPYLSHPTPDAERKSGFLVPKYSTDEIFGATIKTPYYYNWAPDKDLTFTPIITSKEGLVLSGEYRQLLENGSYNLISSITNPSKIDSSGNQIPGKEIRGHIEGKGHFNINNEWDWGFDAKRSTDDTYLEKYNFGDEDVLTSRIYTTAIENRNNINIEAISFQGLNINDDPGKTPLILPHASLHYESNAGAGGSRWTGDASVMSLSRSEGASSNRMSVKGGWQMPFITKYGHVFQLNTSLRGDGYYVNNVVTEKNQSSDGLVGRLVPEIETKWSLPTVKNINGKQLFLSPIANIILSPYGNNPDKIPNEDSQDVEFSDENLFDSNHFTGYDRIESGPRMNYGFRGRYNNHKDGEISFLFGQNYHVKTNNNFISRTGLDDNFSDFVGNIQYQINEHFNSAYRFRVDKETFALNRSVIATELNIKPIKFDLDYLSVDESFDSTTTELSNENRELIIAGGSIDISKQWNISGQGHRDLESGEWVSTKTALLYRLDCIDINFTWFKEFTQDRDIRPNTTLSLEISLKNLGF